MWPIVLVYHCYQRSHVRRVVSGAIAARPSLSQEVVCAWVRFALLVGLLAFPFSIAGAQQGVSSIRGRVVDSQGGVLPGVTVLITHQESGNFRQVLSNVDGTYFVTGIVPGNYRVEAELTWLQE